MLLLVELVLAVGVLLVVVGGRGKGECAGVVVAGAGDAAGGGSCVCCVVEGVCAARAATLWEGAGVGSDLDGGAVVCLWGVC